MPFRCAPPEMGEDFWKKPKIDFWFFIFCVLEVDLFNAGVVSEAAAGDEAAPFALAIVRQVF